MNIKKLVIVLSVFVVTPTLICMSLILYVSLWLANWIDVDACSPRDLDRMARFRLPPSGYMLDSDCAGFRGWTANAKFYMNPDDLNTFMNSTAITGDLTDTGIPERDWCPYSLSEATPHLFAVYDGYQGSRSDGSYVEFKQWIYIDTSSPELYVVYVCAMGG